MFPKQDVNQDALKATILFLPSLIDGSSLCLLPLSSVIGSLTLVTRFSVSYSKMEQPNKDPIL